MSYYNDFVVFTTVMSVIMFAIGIVVYVFYSLGLYTIAKRRNLKYPGLAWVPVASLWILGSIADQYDLITTGVRKKMRYLMVWFSGCLCAVGLIIGIISLATFSSYAIDSSAIIFLPLLAFLIWGGAITLAVFTLIALYKLYRSCSPDNATVLIVLSIFFSVIIPFAVFALRNSDRGVMVYPNTPVSGSY